MMIERKEETEEEKLISIYFSNEEKLNLES